MAKRISGTFTGNTSSAVFQPAIRGTVGGSAKPDTLMAAGTWGTGTITVQVSPDNVTWINLTDGTDTASLSADGVINFQVNAPFARLTMSGATGGEDVDYWIN